MIFDHMYLVGLFCPPKNKLLFVLKQSKAFFSLILTIISEAIFATVKHRQRRRCQRAFVCWGSDLVMAHRALKICKIILQYANV